MILGFRVEVFRVKGIGLGQNDYAWVLVYGGFRKLRSRFPY